MRRSLEELDAGLAQCHSNFNAILFENQFLRRRQEVLDYLQLSEQLIRVLYFLLHKLPGQNSFMVFFSKTLLKTLNPGAAQKNSLVTFIFRRGIVGAEIALPAFKPAFKQAFPLKKHQRAVNILGVFPQQACGLVHVKLRALVKEEIVERFSRYF